jgi:hypothetical protein
VNQTWNAGNLVKGSRSRAVLVPVQNITVPAPNGTTRTVTIDNARYISYPTALYGWCATRGKHVETPSYSLPAHLACPSAVTTDATYQRIKARGLAKRNAQLDTRGASCDHEPRFVCAHCYASKGTFRFGSTVLAHLARFEDSKIAAKDYTETLALLPEQSAYLISGMTEFLRYFANTGITPPLVNHGSVTGTSYTGYNHLPLQMAHETYVYNLIIGYMVGISGYTKCKCCIPRIRHHASGDVWSPSYAALLNIVFTVLTNLYPTLIIWCPTRNGHLMTGIRLLSATLALADIPRVNMVCSGLVVDLSPDQDLAYTGGFSSLSMVGTSSATITSAGYTVCHKQSGSVTHTCSECMECYIPETRTGYIKH